MSRPQYAMVMDLNKCLGCQTCTIACKKLWTDRDGTEYMYWNNVETRPGLGYPRRWDQMGGGWEDGEENYYFYLPRLCNHCTYPACLEACPRKAIYKREEDGIVLIDQERCQGYRYCIAACPYKQIY